MPRDANQSSSARGKSSPTTATSCTGSKKLAATAKYVAAPPSTSGARPRGVSSVSIATDPTTSRLMAAPSTALRGSRVLRDVAADDRRQVTLHLCGNAIAIGDDRVLEG